MPELKWNEYDFVECLGVLSKTDEFFCSHGFTIIKDGLKVDLTLWQYESLVVISIHQESNPKPFIEFSFIVRDKIKFMNEKSISQLIFCDCVFVENRFGETLKEMS